MSKNRITYRNLGDIFVMEIVDENIEVGISDKPSAESGNYLDPFNKYVIIKNIYKYPDRVKEYAEACQFTNYGRYVLLAPFLRTLAPISNVITDVVLPALNESFDRKMVEPPTPSSRYDATIFSYLDPQVIKYQQYAEPHSDGPNSLPLHSAFDHLNSFNDMRAGEPHPSTGESEIVAGIIFLDETFGTEILINKNLSYYRSKNSGTWAAGLQKMFNGIYYPEGNNSHYEHRITIGGEYNSAIFYYGAVPHRPYFPGASDEDLKRGRLIQNIWIRDITEINKAVK